MTILNVHPIVAGMPAINSAEYRRLVDDVRERGQQWPIVLFEGKILDGRARYRACLDVNVRPWLVPLRRIAPSEFYVGANLSRLGEPRSPERCGFVKCLSEFYETARRAAAARERREWIRQARAEFDDFERSPRKPCAVCDAYAEFAHAHHVFPLSLQFDCGVNNPIHDHDWLCPTHHRYVHIVLSGYLLGSRDLSFLDSIPDERTAEWLAIERVAMRGITLCCEVLGQMPGTRRDPPFGLYCAKNHQSLFPWPRQ